MKNLMLSVLVTMPVIVASIAISPARAADIPGYPDNVLQYDSREVALLPSYCKYTQSFRDELHADPAEVARWYDVMGPAFHAMHHYCWGLMKTNRALLLARTQQVRTYYLASSLDEFNYVIRNSSPDFVMLPEIHTKKGENLMRLGRTALGIAELERAIELKPDYWPPYAAISDYYKKKGDGAKAREWLEKALAFAPDAKGLQTRMAELRKGEPRPDR